MGSSMLPFALDCEPPASRRGMDFPSMQLRTDGNACRRSELAGMGVSSPSGKEARQQRALLTRGHQTPSQPGVPGLS